MKVKVLHKFHDRVDFSKVYLVGETYTFDDARAESLVTRGLVESAEEVAGEIPEAEETPIEEIPAVVIEADNEAEAPVMAVKPVATKRKSQPKDN